MPESTLISTTAAPTPVRRTQTERTTAMRRRLMEAALACLEELGYAGFSVRDVVRRAGVTVGALFHHFSTRAELAAEAYCWHSKELWMKEREELLAAIARGASPEEQLRLSWRHWQERAAVDTELIIALRADAELHKAWDAANARYETVEPLYNTVPVAWATIPGDPSPDLTRFIVGYFLTGMQVLAPFNAPDLPEQALAKFAHLLRLASEAMKPDGETQR